MSTMPILPEDLIEEILVRVPTLNLKRFRSVCKQWNALYNDRRFTKRHLIKAKHQFLMIMSGNDTFNLIDFDRHGIHPTVKSSGVLSYHNNICEAIIFHCHGLLLCTRRDFRLFVWNPCLEQMRLIEGRERYILCDIYGLGYDKKKDIYKILKFSSYHYFSNKELRILDLNTDSWRILENVASPECSIAASGVSVKGNGYWLAKKIGMNRVESYMILSFDFTTERFRSFCSLPLFEHSVALSSIRDEKLLVLIMKDSTSYEVWMSSEIDDDKVMCWSKFFNVDFNGGLVCFVTSFLVDEEKKSVVCSVHDRFKGLGTVYVARDGLETVQIDKFEKESWMYPPFFRSYAPSLVQIAD